MIYESGEDYLEAILILNKVIDGVHAKDIVDKLNYSKPSVSIMLKKLQGDGYINIDDNNHITLTDNGNKIATKIYERHQVLTKMFILLGVSEKIAEDDACKIEHDLSDESFDAIKKHVENILKK